MRIKFDITGEVLVSALKDKLDLIRNPKPILRIVAFDVLSMVTERIHEEGKAADGNQIGTYNNNYLKLRIKAYKRTADKKVIVSLTRQLENDWAVIETTQGWGIGFKNILNVNKAHWVEEHFNKVIFDLTTEEREYAAQRANEILRDELNK